MVTAKLNRCSLSLPEGVGLGSQDLLILRPLQIFPCCTCNTQAGPKITLAHMWSIYMYVCLYIDTLQLETFEANNFHSFHDFETFSKQHKFGEE